MAVPWIRRLVAGLSPWSAGFQPGSVHVGFVVGKLALRQVFLRVLGFSPVNCIPPVLHYMERRKKTNHLHHRVAQEASRLRCVRNICCGALHHKKTYHCSVKTLLGNTVLDHQIAPLSKEYLGLLLRDKVATT
jgi:hypothetical protein